MMSNVFDAIAWAIKVSKGEPMPARMLLIVGLAQRVNDRSDGFLVWPSNKQLCSDTDMSRTSVKKWMRHLEEKGFVQRFEAKRDNGTHSSNKYRLAVRAVFYHPTKGAMQDDELDGSPSDPSPLGVGRHPTQEGSVDATPTGRPARPPIEPPDEPPLEDSTPPRAAGELDLGLPPIPPKDPTPADLTSFISEQWAARAFATPLRGGALSAANLEKAVDLAKKNQAGEETTLDVWTAIFEKIDGSDFLQGKVPGREGRAPFKLSISFALEKRNFDKILGGRFDGKSTGEPGRGSASQATGNVLNRLRTRGERGADRGNPRLANSSR
jgi:hypothetical protein